VVAFLYVLGYSYYYCNKKNQYYYYLGKAGLIENMERGGVKITPRGIEALESYYSHTISSSIIICYIFGLN
jgi:predicted transcriptional regulator